VTVSDSVAGTRERVRSYGERNRKRLAVQVAGVGDASRRHHGAADRRG
jgi:hypothetical protein